MKEPDGHQDILERLKTQGGGVCVGPSRLPGHVRVYLVRGAAELWHDLTPERAVAIGKALHADADRARHPTLFDLSRPPRY